MTERTWLALAAACLAIAPTWAAAQASAPAPARPLLEPGAVLDGAYVSRALALGSREEGLGLGHTEFTLGAAIDDLWNGRLTAVAHNHDGSLETELEEAFVETSALPGGLQLRAGRFLSQIGYLNELHTHGDDFTERPLLYRAFLGSHYFDNGARIAWVAPTPFYWRFGAEVFSGKQLVQEASNNPRVGVFTVNTRIGGDLGLSHSWQLGASYLRNSRQAAPHEDDGSGSHDHDHDHAHAHGAAYSGRHLALIDAVWKWAPDGNNRERQLRVSTEYARVTGLNAFARSSDRHEAWYGAVAYRFAPQWEAAVRVDDLRVREPHGDHFHSGHLREASTSLTWKRSHFSALRLQWTGQRDRGGFDNAVRSSVQLQYVMSLGAHGAHPF